MLPFYILTLQETIKGTKQVLLLALMCCFSFYTLFSQTIPPPDTLRVTIKGVIVDSASKETLSYVTVMVQETGTNRFIAKTLSNENGFFRLTGLPYKKYQLILTYVGYKAKTVLLPDFTSSTVHIGTITMAANVTRLKEIQVLTQKKLVEQDIDKLTYNVDADPESKTATAFDILRKVPLLTIDADDNLQLNGNSNYRILINGKPSSLFLSDQSDVFKNMEAASIKTIEVITVPASRYEAAGVGGIINIITYKKNIGGYSGSVAIRASSPKGLSTNGYLNVNMGKFSLSGNLGYNNSTSPVNSTSFYREDRIRQNKLEQTGTSSNKNQNQNNGSEIIYELNSLNLITASYSKNNGNGGNGFTQQAALLNAAGELAQAYKNQNTGKSKSYGNDFGLDYQRSFKKNEAQQLMLLYKWTNSFNTSSSDFTFLPLVNYKGRVSTTNNNDGFNEHNFQADYTQPIKKHTLELGVNTILRQNNSDYFYKNRDTVTGAFVLDTNQSNKFNYKENIYAGYTSLDLRMGKWSLKLAARLEQVKIDAHFVSSGTIAEQDYSNLIPNITLSRLLKGISMIKLSYTQRIERPNLYYLNPYVDLTDPWNISYGNPNLRPALGHVFNLAYNTFIKRTSIGISIFHQFTNNSIQQFTTLYADTIARSTFGNIGKNKNYSLSLSGNSTLFKKLSINLSGTANYVQYTSFINSKQNTNEGLTYNMAGSINLRLKNWRVGGNLNYSAPNLFIQGKTASYISNNIAVSKYFFKNNKGNLGLSVNSPFHEYRRSSTEIDDPTFYQLRESNSVIRRYSLSFNYRFSKIQGNNNSKKEQH